MLLAALIMWDGPAGWVDFFGMPLGVCLAVTLLLLAIAVFEGLCK